jgi:hypothetical protein
MKNTQPVKLMGKVKKAKEEEVAVVNAKEAENSALNIAESKLDVNNPLDSFLEKSEKDPNVQSILLDDNLMDDDFE